MSLRKNIFAAIYDPMSRKSEDAGLRALRRGLLAEAGGSVLEIGAGTGGTTGYVLQRLPADRTDYLFTDVSPLFLERAAEEFSAWPFLRRGLLDIERDPLAQGFAGGSADIVIAANVLHATADLRTTLANTVKLLAPGGALLLQFREQPKELSPQDSVIKMRAERDRIMQCVLHFEPDRVWVTDVVHEWNGQAWLTTKSTYPKLRISTEAVLEIASTAGLNIRFNETLTRQRVLVLTRGDSK